MLNVATQRVDKHVDVCVCVWVWGACGAPGNTNLKFDVTDVNRHCDFDLCLSNVHHGINPE
jgi:hypothetical protein